VTHEDDIGWDGIGGKRAWDWLMVKLLQAQGPSPPGEYPILHVFSFFFPPWLQVNQGWAAVYGSTR
jgi:hypothetical protein